MKKLTDILKEAGIEMGKIYTDKDKPPFQVNEKKEDVIYVPGLAGYSYKGLLAGFKKSKDKRLEVVARAVSFLIKTQFGSGAKNDFIKAFKKSL